MLQPTPRSPEAAPATPRAAGTASSSGAGRPFLGLLDAVMVDPPTQFRFEGAVSRPEVETVWRWFVRDIAADLLEVPLSLEDQAAAAALTERAPELLARARAALATSKGKPEAEARLRAQLGDGMLERLPVVLNAFKCHPLLGKAQAFGRALNGIQEDAALATALQAIPLQDSAVAPFLLMAAMGQVINPGRLVVVASRVANGAADTEMVRAGFGPLLDAILAQAQNVLPPLLQVGAFLDMDLACRAIERFHRLIRAIAANLALTRNGRWSTISAGLIKTVSDRLEPKIRDVTPAVSQALRRQREGAERLDSDSILSALNGFYLLATVRDCRDSLALNAIFDQTWNQAGQALEMHLNRNLELWRDNPADTIAAARVESGIKMAELRFGSEYADVLRRARDAIERRLGTSN